MEQKHKVIVTFNLPYMYSSIPRRKKKIEEYDPKTLSLLNLLKNYRLRCSLSNVEDKKVSDEINILEGIIKHPALPMKSKYRQFADRYYRVSRPLLKPHSTKKALRWVFRKLDNFANLFRKKSKFSLSNYFAQTNINEDFFKKVDNKLRVEKSRFV